MDLEVCDDVGAKLYCQISQFGNSSRMCDNKIHSLTIKKTSFWTTLLNPQQVITEKNRSNNNKTNTQENDIHEASRQRRRRPIPFSHQACHRTHLMRNILKCFPRISISRSQRSDQWARVLGSGWLVFGGFLGVLGIRVLSLGFWAVVAKNAMY